ncbi:MAG: hypothetical protein U5L72_13670 [Bacteroidales bacterium]|nr:hypothetical protein [Bacteroidales bacterium]
MFEREPNIDIVFRNGLKNMEVLPPADVWDNIPPMPVRRSPLRIITRIAAGVAALVSLALMASWYMRSNNTGDTLKEITIASGEQQAVTIDMTTAIADALTADRPTAVITNQTSPVEPVTETILTLPADEPLRLLASADMPLPGRRR